MDWVLQRTTVVFFVLGRAISCKVLTCPNSENCLPLLTTLGRLIRITCTPPVRAGMKQAAEITSYAEGLWGPDVRQLGAPAVMQWYLFHLGLRKMWLGMKLCPT